MNIHELLERYNLKPQHAYLLEIVPLIEMMWADGRNQRKEISIIHDITDKLVSELNGVVDGITVISEKDVRDFFNRFVHVRPPASLLKELRELTVDWLDSKDKIQDKSDTIMGHCLDIAAACATTDKYDARIVEQEKALLKKLASAFKVSA